MTQSGPPQPPPPSGGPQPSTPGAAVAGGRQRGPAGRAGAFTLILATLALLLALTSTALAIYAIGVANGAKDEVAGPPAAGASTAETPRNGPTDTPVAPTEESTTPQGAGPSPGELDPSAKFTTAYSPEKKTLVINPPGSGSNRVDLDKPQVNVGYGDQADLELVEDKFRFPVGVRAATATSPDVEAGDCAELIETSALAADAVVPVGTENLTLCILTSFGAAQQQGITWKVVVLHVTSVANNGSVQVSVKAWNAPTG